MANIINSPITKIIEGIQIRIKVKYLELVVRVHVLQAPTQVQHPEQRDHPTFPISHPKIPDAFLEAPEYCHVWS